MYFVMYMRTGLFMGHGLKSCEVDMSRKTGNSFSIRFSGFLRYNCAVF